MYNSGITKQIWYYFVPAMPLLYVQCVYILLCHCYETTNLIQGRLTWQFINGHHRHPQIHLEVLALPQRPHPRNSAWDIKRNSMKQRILSNHHVFVQQLIIQSLWVLIYDIHIVCTFLFLPTWTSPPVSLWFCCTLVTLEWLFNPK